MSLCPGLRVEGSASPLAEVLIVEYEDCVMQVMGEHETGLVT